MTHEHKTHDHFHSETAAEDPIERSQQIQEILEVTLRQAVQVMQPPPKVTLDGQPAQGPGPQTMLRCCIANQIVLIQGLALLIETLVPEASVKGCRETLALRYGEAQGEG